MRNILVIITYFIVPWIALILVRRAVKKGYLWKEDQRNFIALFIGGGIINTIGLVLFWGNGIDFIFIVILIIVLMGEFLSGSILGMGICIVVAILGIRRVNRRHGKKKVEEDKDFNEERGGH